MWLREFEGFYTIGYTNAWDAGSETWRLYAFDPYQRTHTEVSGDAGDVFIPLSGNQVFNAFGKILVIGTSQSLDGTSDEGREIWEIEDGGALRLFADIVPGAVGSVPSTLVLFDLYGNNSVWAIHSMNVNGTHGTILLRADGSSVFVSDTLPDVDRFWAIDAVEYRPSSGPYSGDRAWFISRIDTSSYVVLEADPVTGEFIDHSGFLEEATNPRFTDLMIFDGTLYVYAYTEESHNQLFWFNEAGLWQKVPNEGWPTGVMGPKFAFEMEGRDYFVAQLNGASPDWRDPMRLTTLELYELTTDAMGEPILSLVTNFNASPVLSLGWESDFYVLGGTAIATVYDGQTWIDYSITSDGVVSEAAAFFLQPGATDVVFRMQYGDGVLLVDRFAEGDRMFFMDADLGVTEIDMPSEFQAQVYDWDAFFDVNGQLFAQTTAADQGITLWVLGEGGTWRQVVDLPGFQGTARGFSGSSYVDLPWRSGDVYFGDATDETITAPTDSAVIYGEGGADRVTGGDLTDIVFGGAGRDRVQGGAGDDQIWGEGGNDRLVGDAGADQIDGGVGDDVIRGGSGADTIWAGEGHDTVRGSRGADLIYLDAGDDQFFDLAQGGDDGADVVYGGAGNDTLLGDGGSDTLEGGDGEDWIEGGVGADLIFGGGQSDTIDAGSGDDTVNAGLGADDVKLGGGHDLFVDIGQSGPQGADRVLGGGGDDRFEIWGGNDTVSGGPGADVFAFRNGFDQDTITDFELGIDRIDLTLWSYVSGFGDLTVNDGVDGAEVTAAGDLGAKIILNGVLANDLSDADFLFV